MQAVLKIPFYSKYFYFFLYLSKTNRNLLYLIILLLAHILCAGSLLKKFQLLYILMFHLAKVKEKINENFTLCNKKLLKFEEYGWASVAFWQIRKHEIALFCSGQTEPYATTLALATLWPLHFPLCDKWQLEDSHGWGASGGFYEKLSEYIRVHYCAASSQTGPSVTTLAFMASPTVTTAESVFYFQDTFFGHSSDILSHSIYICF